MLETAIFDRLFIKSNISAMDRLVVVKFHINFANRWLFMIQWKILAIILYSWSYFDMFRGAVFFRTRCSQRRRYCGRRRLCVWVCLSVRPAATARRNAALVSAAKVMRCVQCCLVYIVFLSNKWTANLAVLCLAALSCRVFVMWRTNGRTDRQV